ncbi:MAG: alpha-L-fucosidase [Promethearchaeota archaeon]
MKYSPTIESLKKHEVPAWFHDAKLGIFIHWGLYSVPAFAVTGLDLIQSMKRGIEEHFKNNPYAEWYLNSLRIPSETQKYHFEKYGKDFTYDDFVEIFNEEIKKWNPDEWAGLFKKAGAKYVVLVTKHHDGFLMWPSKHPNPKKKNYHASRNIVAELSAAVRKKGMKMGFYYSGSLDWSFNPQPIVDIKTFLKNGVRTPEYIEYANSHWRELIEEYKPDILWNDIGYPPNNLLELFSYYYNEVPEGVINDRWEQLREKGDDFPKVDHSDFITPEYKTFKKIKKKKWESTRGIGNSFGYNQFESEEDYLKSEELIRMFVDIVSKNGNLLLNVGPMADGTIPEAQKKVLLSLGQWLEINGEAIYGTRPWIRSSDKANENIEIRYTCKENDLYLFIMELPSPSISSLSIPSLVLEKSSKILLLGQDNLLKWHAEQGHTRIFLPSNLPESPVHVIKITPKPQ